MNSLDHQALPGRGQRRLDVVHAHHLAAAAISSVGMPLGMWAGRGDYAMFSDASRDKAGARALAELDAAITELTAVRDRLAAALATEQDPPVTDTEDAPGDLGLPLEDRAAAALYLTDDNAAHAREADEEGDDG